MKKSKNDYGYGWEKLYNAIRCLTGSGEQKARIIGALLELSTLTIPEEKYLPDEIQKEFNEFWKEMTSVKAVGDEGTIRATVNNMNATGIRGAIDKIIDFYDTVCRYMKHD